MSSIRETAERIAIQVFTNGLSRVAIADAIEQSLRNERERAADIAVPPQQMKYWPAEAITQFFNGIAMIVYAAGKNAHVEVVRTEERPKDD